MSNEVILNDGVVAKSAGLIAQKNHFVSFRGRALVLNEDGEYEVLTKAWFERVAYRMLGGVSRSRIGDVFSFVCSVAPDVTPIGHLVLMGDKIWDTRKLDFVDTEDPRRVIWRSKIQPIEGRRSDFVWSLAGEDQAHYDDIMQSLAPILSEQKPTGVIWWIGEGANGKSSLMEAVERIFPKQLSSLTIKQLTDERDTPLLNGRMANIVKESSEGRIEDTKIYKSIGAHEDFDVHKFHSQDTIRIHGNIHHIFSANNVPTFADKNYSIRRRTFPIPFNQKFKNDPTFEDRTFTPRMLGILLGEMIRYTRILRDRQFQYKFSVMTTDTKQDLDMEMNNVEEYVKEIVNDGVVAYESFRSVKNDYDNWCAESGYVPLGINTLRKVLARVGFDRSSIKYDKKYVLCTVEDRESLAAFDMSRPGLYTLSYLEKEMKAKIETVDMQQLISEDW